MATYLIGNVKGPKGEDGYSPKASVQQTSNGAVITIEDKSGITSAVIRDGVDADGNNIDLTPYATKVEVQSQIEGLADTYATKEELEDIDIPVTTVNGMTGDVVITPPDLTGYATQAWIQQQGYMTSAPVESVNGKTGTVVLDAEDVGALPDSTVIPTAVSELTNDSDFVSNATLNSLLQGKQDTLTAGNNITIQNNVISASGGSSFSGDYDDLTNKPDLSVYAKSADLATVATTGDYDDLTNKPTIPTYTAGNGIEITNDEISVLVDGTTIQYNGDGELEAISSGSGSVDLIYEMSSPYAQDNAALLALAADGNIPVVILYNRKYYILTRKRVPSGSVAYDYICSDDGNGDYSLTILYLTVVFTSDYQTLTSISTGSGASNGSVIPVGITDIATNFPSASNSNLGPILNSIPIDYAKKSDLSTKQDTLTAGSGITITNNVISATGGGGASYTAGSGIYITNNEINVDTDNLIPTYEWVNSQLDYKQHILQPLTGITLNRSSGSAAGQIGVDFSVVASKSDIENIQPNASDNPANALYLTSSNGAIWEITVDDSGNLSATEIGGDDDPDDTPSTPTATQITLSTDSENPTSIGYGEYWIDNLDGYYGTYDIDSLCLLDGSPVENNTVTWSSDWWNSENFIFNITENNNDETSFYLHFVGLEDESMTMDLYFTISVEPE